MGDALPDMSAVRCSARENVTYLDVLALHRALRKLELVIVIAVGWSFPTRAGYSDSMPLAWVGRFR
jgi:hypothetical protein